MSCRSQHLRRRLQRLWKLQDAVRDFCNRVWPFKEPEEL